MELGLTIPLQRFLEMKPPARGAEPDRRFCRDLHVIDLRGRKCLLAVHCNSRYAFVRYDVPPHAVNTRPSRCVPPLCLLFRSPHMYAESPAVA